MLAAQRPGANERLAALVARMRLARVDDLQWSSIGGDVSQALAVNPMISRPSSDHTARLTADGW